MGVNHQKVGRVERGARSLSVDYLIKVSKALDTSIDSLLTEQAPQASKDENLTQLQPKVLNEIVILVEKTMPHIAAEQKGKLISNVYEQALKFPENQQLLFAHSAFELIKFVCDFSSNSLCTTACCINP